MSDNTLCFNNHLLICIKPPAEEADAIECDFLKLHFFGRVICIDSQDLTISTFTVPSRDGQVYICGNLQPLVGTIKRSEHIVKIIKELSDDLGDDAGLEFVTLGDVPMSVNNVGVYYRNCLIPRNPDTDYFTTLQSKHMFQALTESNKPNKAFRKGVYLSEVENDHGLSSFHLLRCSANLSGPTVAFADEDREIVSKVNELARQNFEQRTELNHVLAQVYENSFTVNEGAKAKEHKAKIKDHSDKTKDMPANGLIAFCTFYSPDINSKTYKSKPHDRFNRFFKDASVLTQLRFKLKPDVEDTSLKPDFRVPLYPNSVLLIPLSTNRLYTHEIVPPTLPVGKFPTRLGYVVRCSKTKAVFKDNTVFLQRGTEEVKLVDPKEGEIFELKGLYQKENVTSERVDYRDFDFSLNEGDYLKPVVE